MATIKEVAKKSQVSIATVSHIMNGTRFVSEELTKRVREAIEELGYQPHVSARNLRKKKTHIIGLILPDNTNPFFAEIARGMEDTCFKNGYSTILCNSDNNMEKETAYLRLLGNKGVDGTVYISIGYIDEVVTVLQNQEQSIVLMDRVFSDVELDAVLVDNRGGARLAVERLIELGHRRIGFLSGLQGLLANQEREAGCREALRAAGLSLEERYYMQGDFTMKSGQNAFYELFEHPPLPSAIFAANDLMAIGVLNAARNLGLTIPQDCSVIGFDNIAPASYCSPRLSTVAQPQYQIGQRIAEILLNRIRYKDRPYTVEVFSTYLVERESHGVYREQGSSAERENK